MTVVGAACFLFFVVGLRAWDGYVALVDSDPRVRRLVLLGDHPDAAPGRDAGAPETPEMKRRNRAIDQAQTDLRLATQLALQGKPDEAIRTYRRAIDRCDRFVGSVAGINAQGNGPVVLMGALIRNNLAWYLALGVEPARRDLALSEVMAREASAIAPFEGNYANTLGLALYRAGKLDEAAAAVDRSMSLRRGGDAYDWLILAMIRRAQGRPADARPWFDRAETSEGTEPADPDRQALRVEAAVALGLPVPAPRVDPGARATLGRRVSHTAPIDPSPSP